MPKISMHFNKVLLPLIFKITVHLYVYVHVYTCLRAEKKLPLLILSFQYMGSCIKLTSLGMVMNTS